MTAHRWPKSNSPSKIKLQLTSGQDEHETYRLSRKVCDFERPSNVMPQKWLLSFSSFQQKILKHFWEVISKIGNNWLPIIRYPSVPHRPPQFNTSVQHKDHTFSAPKIRQLNTKNPSAQHFPQFNTSLSSTHPSVQHPPQFYTKNPSF